MRMNNRVSKVSFGLGFILGILITVSGMIGLFVLVEVSGPRANENPVELLRLIETSYPSRPSVQFIDFIQLVGKPVVDMRLEEGDRSFGIQVHQSDWHFFETVWDDSGQLIFVHYFTGGARLSREKVFVYDQEQYEWLVLNSSIVNKQPSD